jgi:hypothetical protein
MEKEFVPYDQALALQKLGFDEPCFRGWYEDESLYYHPDSDIVLDNPTFSQAFRWFRKKYGLVGIIKFGTNDFTYNVYNEDGMGLLTKESLNFNGNYEEAEFACLKKLIQIVKERK